MNQVILADASIPRHRAQSFSGHPGIGDARSLPDPSFATAWNSIVLPAGTKEQIAQTAAATFVLRQEIPFERLPLHGVVLLTGPPGTGKTTLARGLADRVARLLSDGGDFSFLEVNSHDLVSSSLGRSQKAVAELFSSTIYEATTMGPLIVLVDEVETVVTSRQKLSLDANPIDVHRAVDAALVGLDNLSRSCGNVLVVATSNCPEVIDTAFLGRVDHVTRVGLPDATARRAILEDSLTALVECYPAASHLLDGQVLDKAVTYSAGIDGRQLRKVLASAAGRRPESTVDPGELTATDFLGAIQGLAEKRG